MTDTIAITPLIGVQQSESNRFGETKQTRIGLVTDRDFSHAQVLMFPIDTLN